MPGNSWIFLLIAIFFGVLGTISMKMSQGFKKLKPSLYLLVCYVICFITLTMAVKGIGISIVYAIWSGIGTVFVSIIGIFLFEESISFKKIISILLIVLGIIGIYLASALH